jgi:hypothetical protein
MSRLARPMSLFLVLLAVSSCHHRGWRRSSRHSRAVRPTASSAPSAPVPTPESEGPHGGIVATTAPSFSAPIAAARTSFGTVVAGFVATEGVVRVTSLGQAGTLWTLDAVRGATWAPDADVKLEAAGDAVVLLWRSGRAERHAGTLIVIGQDGKPRGGPQDVGVAECATDDGLTWIEPSANGPYRVRGRTWADATPRDRMAIPLDRTPTLVCDDRSAFVLGDGDDLTAARIGEGVATEEARVVIRAADFSDDELEHDAFAVEGKLELLRISNAGALATREVPREGPPSPWRKLKHRLSEDDDVVAVDGDATTTLAVFTHEAEDACPAPDSPALRLRALRIDRVSGAESVLDLSAPSCQQSPSPIWIDTPRGAPPIVAWAEQTSRAHAGAPSVRGLAYSVIGAEGAARPKRIALDAETIADAGCRDGECSAAALLLPPDGDATKPMAIAVVRYP